MQAQVGGKIAQLGARLIDASAKAMADQFFDRFVNEVTGGPVEAGAAIGAAAELPARPTPISVFSLIPREPLGFPRVAWVGGVICLAILLLIFSAYF